MRNSTKEIRSKQVDCTKSLRNPGRTPENTDLAICCKGPGAYELE